MSKRLIPVAAPSFHGNERKYVLDCLDSTWISSAGKYVDGFETAFAQFCEAKHAVSCCNGTVALHLALLALGIGPGDEVIVPTLTYIATANAVTYCGAAPVLVDSEPQTWNIDPAAIESRITAATKAIIVVHLYGHPVDMDAIADVARRHKLYVVEDAAEAHGAKYKGRAVGAIGDIGIFSFYGNKIITTGEGGMVTTNDPDLAARVKLLKGQGMDPARRYWFPIVGYNYRMTNIAAAIGLAQLEQVAWHLERRAQIAGWYREVLQGTPDIAWQDEQPWAKHVYWMFTVVVAGHAAKRDRIMQELGACGIETRPVFYPMHVLPPYAHLASSGDFHVAETIAARGINLPSSGQLTREDVSFICERLKTSLAGRGERA